MTPEEFGLEPGRYVDVWTIGGTRFECVKVEDLDRGSSVRFSDEGYPLIIKTSAIVAVSYVY
ncbi:hypothetical protein ACWCPQ_14440 [Nocardia sp. NPDC001965]